jgi:hypothetical protein
LGPTPDSVSFLKLLVRVVSMGIMNSVVKSYVVISCTTVKMETSVFKTWSVSIIRVNIVNPDK